MVQQGEMVEHQTAHIALEADVGYGVLEILGGGRSISALCCKRAAKTAYRDGFVHDQLSAIDRDPGDAVRYRHLVDQGTVGVPERLQVLYRFGVIGQLRQIHGAQRLQMAPRERERRENKMHHISSVTVSPCGRRRCRRRRRHRPRFYKRGEGDSEQQQASKRDEYGIEEKCYLPNVFVFRFVCFCCHPFYLGRWR